MTSSSLEMWGLTTSEMTEIFSPSSLVAAMLRFEQSLALALYDAGLAPEGPARAVARACEDPIEDPLALLQSTWMTGSPVIALTDEIRGRLDTDEQRDWVHYGSTTQDVIDTAQMIVVSKALETLTGTVERIARRMRDVASTHRETVQMGRTFLQHARPTSFGMRVAGWLDPTLRHIETLRMMKDGLVVQFGGPVGDRSGYGDRGPEVARALGERLGMAVSDIAWHTDRSRIRSLAAAVGDLTGTMAKIALDIALLAQSEVEEVEVRSGGSSSLADKRNPIDAIRAMAAADISRGAASIIEGARPHELDRGLGAWHSELVALPILFQAAASATSAIESCLGSLTVDVKTMTARAGNGGDQAVGAIDQGQIDAVLSRFDEILGPE